MRNLSLLPAALSGLLIATTPVHAEPGDDVYETCPSAEDVGTNVACYPVTIISKTEIHPEGIPVIAYLFVPADRPAEPLPAIVFAHGSGSMYSNGHHNAGLNSKHEQWVRQYTSELGFVTLHVDSFHSRYLLPDTPGDQRIMEIDVPPEGLVGGDDYRATSYEGSRNAATRIDVAFDPAPASDEIRWKDSDNGEAGVSEVMERAYDMDAAWDFLAGIRKGRFVEAPVSRNDDNDEPTLATPATGIGYIGEIVSGLVVDHEKIFLYGTSHGGQAAMAAAHESRALGDANPMNMDLPEGFDRHRFAGFFDYYGGCGLHGAYGGGSDSTWRPYAPFLMLHADHDDKAVFDDDEVPVDSVEEFSETTCGKRIAAAKADAGFDRFLEAVVYENAYHSFDGVERGDFNSEDDPDFGSWLAKIHANYRVTVPFMEATSRLVNAKRAAETGPSRDALGIAPLMPYLASFTVPVRPYLPPRFQPSSGVMSGDAVVIPDLAGFTLDLNDVFRDPFGDLFPIRCEGFDLPENIDIDPGCLLQLSLAADQMAGGAIPLAVAISTEKGTLYQPMMIETANGSGALTFGQGIGTLPPGAVLSSLNPGFLLLDLRGFAWTDYPPLAANLIRFENTSADAYSILDLLDPAGDHVVLFGDNAPADAVADVTAISAMVDGWGVAFDLEISDAGNNRAIVRMADTLAGFNRNPDLFQTPPAGGENPNAGFVAPGPVSADAPPPAGQFPKNGEENDPPAANAGSDQDVESGSTVALDGGASSDPENMELLFAWEQTGGTPVQLSGATQSRATFVAPKVEKSESLVFELVVTDSEGESDADSITIAVSPSVNGAPDGAVLYAQRCASCHGNLANSERRNRSADDIRAAIDSVPQMQGLDFLSDEEIEAIATALKSDGTSVPNPNNPGGGSGGGGGALFWLLPFVLRFRRR